MPRGIVGEIVKSVVLLAKGFFIGETDGDFCTTKRSNWPVLSGSAAKPAIQVSSVAAVQLVASSGSGVN